MQFKRAADDGTSTIYEARKATQTEEIITPWGNAIVMPGVYVFSRDDERFAVTEEDASNTNLWVKL